MVTMWFRCLTFVAAVIVCRSEELTIVPNRTILGIGQDSRSLLILNTTSSNHSADQTLLWTLEATSQHDDMSYVEPRQNLTFNVSGGCLYAQLKIHSGRLIGENIITLNSTVEFTNGDVIQVSVDYVTQIVTNPSHLNTFNILCYLFYPILLTLLFTTCVDVNLPEVRPLVSWIGGTCLIQAVLIPLIVVIIATLFGVKRGSQLGIITIAFSPGVLLALPFGVFFDANLTLLISLLFASTVSAFVVMPLWTLQYTKEVLSPSDVPFLALLLQLVLMLTVAAIALLSRHQNLNFINNVKQINRPLSIIAIIYWFFADIYGASDFILSVDIATCAAAALPSILLGLIILPSVSYSEKDTDKWKACVVFLLLKGNTFPFYTLTSALGIAMRSTNLVGVFFYSLVSFLVALVALIVYGVLRFLNSKHLLTIPVQNVRNDNHEERHYVGYSVMTNDRFDNPGEVAVGKQQRQVTQPLPISASPNLFIWT